ncbi:mas-related G-protein coupled receptor member X4-like [Trichosurus vulpecula]|uniref:mas-related G-protein coupled receptor member X4-like n=1 Tax=Trichosurus vulpecula TaxID=9337 RepID=UPI00186AC3E0|nr:mas-related G-protein coupled receptor member X4-like [Trichosurus vulpecula]
MAVSPTPERWEHVYFNATERSEIESLVFAATREFYLSGWMPIFSLVIVLVGLVGNSMVLWLLGFCIPRNPFSVYILNLAGADVLFLSCSFLISIHEFVKYLSSAMYAVLIHLAYTSYSVGLSHLATISTERCLAVFFHNWYLHRRPKNTSAAVCAVLWALASLFWVADSAPCIYVTSQVFRGAISRIPVVWLIHFTPVLCASSLTLLLRVQCSSQHQQPPRLCLLVLLMVLVFLLCGLPMTIQGVIWHFSLDFMPYWLTTLLACLKSSAYPIIYFLLGRRSHRRGREPLRVVLQRALADEQELEGGRRDSHLTNTRETSF